MSQDFLNYPLLIDAAMRLVVRDVMRHVQAEGLPGEHHFYISFDTQHPGVRMSELLRSKYPKDITIVLQHQFWDFKVEDSQFHVTLSFGGIQEKLTVPFAALTAFADPSIKFGLQFQTSSAGIVPATNANSSGTNSSGTNNGDKQESSSADDDDASSKVISLDSFRKK